MKKLLVYILRGISYVALPIGEYVVAWPMTSPSLANLLQLIIPTDLAGEIAVIILLIVLPLLIIFFLHPPKETLAMENGAAVTKKRFGVIRRPTLKELLVNLMAIFALSFIEALPALLWILILGMLFNPACGKYHITDILNILYCLIRR